MGHLDVIKKFGHFPEGGVEGYVMPCLDLIVDKEICVEINTSGLDRPAKDTYPSLNLLKALYDRGIQVTLGSDAHDPKEVGRNFDYVLTALKKSGYREIVQFEKKVKKTIKI